MEIEKRFIQQAMEARNIGTLRYRDFTVLIGSMFYLEFNQKRDLRRKTIEALCRMPKSTVADCFQNLLKHRFIIEESGLYRLNEDVKNDK